MIWTTLYWLLYRFILICIYYCNGCAQPKARLRILPVKQQIQASKRSMNLNGSSASESLSPEPKKRKAAHYSTPTKDANANSGPQKAPTRPNGQAPSLKRKAALELYTEPTTYKKKKIQNIRHPSNSYPHLKKEELLQSLPIGSFFTALKDAINAQDRQLPEEMVDKLLALPRLKIPYTLLSSLLTKYNADSCSALLNKVLVKQHGCYQMATPLEQILNHGIKLNTITSLLHKCGNKAPEAFMQLVTILTTDEILDKLKKLKKIGLESSNLSTMLYGSGNKAPEAAEALINTLSEEKKFKKVQKLKEAGMNIHNLSSILYGCHGKAPVVAEALINTLSEEKELKKVQKLKEAGINIRNLSSMLHGYHNTTAESFMQLVHTLTADEMLQQLKQLNAKGIQPNNISAMLIRSGIKASDRLTNVIGLLTNDQYVNTIQKITAAMHSNPNLINENNAILVSKSASKRLQKIGDLRKIKFVRDPSNDKTFKQFLTNCYNKNKHVDTRLMTIEKVSNDDPRQALHGQDKVVAKQKIPKGTILGIYTGILLCEEDSIDHAVELAYLATKNIYGLNKINSYSVRITGSLYLSGCGRGNILMKINANKTYNDNDDAPQSANVSASLNSCDGNTPFVLFYATEDIPAHTELLYDYGKQYWDNHDNNNTLSNPDAKIYRELLNKKKYLAQAESIRLLKLAKEHSHDLYQDLLKNIERPSKDFSWKDRVVACRKINDPLNKEISYRIYKLPGDEAKGETTQDYFSVSLDEVKKYRNKE